MKKKVAISIHIFLAVLMILVLAKMALTDYKESSRMEKENELIHSFYQDLEKYRETETAFGKNSGEVVNLFSLFKEKFVYWEEELMNSLDLDDLPRLEYRKSDLLQWVESEHKYRNIYLLEILENQRSPLFKDTLDIEATDMLQMNITEYFAQIHLNKLMSSPAYLDYMELIEFQEIEDSKIRYYPVRVIEEVVTPIDYSSILDYATENNIKSRDVYFVVEMIMDYLDNVDFSKDEIYARLKSKQDNFAYSITDKQTEKIIYSYGEIPDDIHKTRVFKTDGKEEILIYYVGPPIQGNIVIHPSFDQWLEKTASMNSKLFFSLFGLELMLTIFLGWAVYQDPVRKTLFGKIPTEIALLGILLTLFICYVIGKTAYHSFYELPFNQIFFILTVSLSYLIALVGYLSFFRRVKDREIITNSLIYKLFRYIKKVLGYLHHQTQETILAILNVIGLFMVTYLLVRGLGGKGWLISFVIHLLVAHWYFKIAMEREYIIKGLEIIGGGNLDYQLDEAKLHGKNKILGRCVNQVAKGLKVAIESSLVNEKMQAELITNISHDLKTPLTSIINYIHLIQQPNLSQEDHDEYIQIIDKKANRLKRLTEDVVEISRSASGKIDLDQQLLDIGELMSQLMAEWEDRFRQKNLDIRLDNQLGSAIVYADGRQTFRILENCFSNIDKYALEHSRVYISIEQVSLAMNREMIRITMKNISVSELNILPEALFDKFTRGNKARTGPSGSGLGLSIARNLARLQGGDMNIQIDGDLFKIILDLPMGKEEEGFPEEEVNPEMDIDIALDQALKSLDEEEN